MFFSPMRALRDAVQSANAGDFGDAERILTSALDKMLPASQCRGKKAEERFLLLALLSDILRKSTGNAEKELELLSECAVLAKQVPPPPPGPDHLFNQVYMVHLNRGNAAGRVGGYALAEQSYAAALEAARDPETRCKCLAYQGWAIIRDRNKPKLDQAWRCFDRFDKICATLGQFLESTGHSVSPSLVAYVQLGRVVQRLYEDDLAAARRACEGIIAMSSTPGPAEQLLQLLRRDGVKTEDVIRFVVDGRDDLAGETAKKPLAPLPKGL